MTAEDNKEGRFPGKPGAILRRLRRERGWSLAELSKRTGLPTSTLSKVENGKMSLTYDKLTRISEGLDVDFARIFGEDQADSRADRKSAVVGRRSITRRGEGGVIDTPSYNHVYAATDLLDKKFVPIVGEIKQRSIKDFGELIRHEGEEYTFVLEGAVEFHSDLYAPVVLQAGDAVYFDSSMGHAYLAVGEARCRVLSICAGSGMHESKIEARNAAASRAKSETPPPAPEVRRGRGHAAVKSPRAAASRSSAKPARVQPAKVQRR